MTVKTNGAEGSTSGTAITTSAQTAVGGDQLTRTGTPTTLEFQSTGAAQGSLCYHYQYSSGNTATLMWTGLSSTQAAIRRSVYLPAFGSVGSSVMAIYNSSIPIAVVYVSTTGRLTVQDAVGAVQFDSGSGNLMSTSTIYYFDLVAIPGTTTGNGTINFRVYNSSGSTVSGLSMSSAVTTANTGTTNIANVQFGKGITSASTHHDYMDALYLNDNTSSFVGPPSTPPTAAFSTTVYGHTLVTADASTAGGGSITGWSWTFGDGGTSTSQNPVYRYTTAGTYTVGLTVTQTDSQTNNVTHSAVPVDGSVDVKFATITTGSANFTPTSGSGNSGIQTVIADSSLSSFASTDGTTAVSNFVIQGTLAPIGPKPSSGQPLLCTLNADGLSGSSRTVGAKLYDFDGTTLISTGQLVNATTGALTGTTTIPVPLYTDTSDGGAAGTGNGTSGTVNRTILIGFPSSEIASMTDSGWDRSTVALTFNAS